MSIEKQLDKLDFGREPVAPRLAASVLVARPFAGPGGFELLMMQRPGRDAFAGGQVVFPGGKVDAADYEDAAGLAPDEPAVDPEHRDAIWRAAARELYEEMGLLLGNRPAPTDFPSGASLRDRGAFYEALRRHGLSLALDRLSYWTNWVTPAPMPMRYDTFFFLALVEPNQAVAAHPGEVRTVHWFHPRAALEAYAASRIDIMFPTFKNLEQLAAIEGLDQLTGFVRAFPRLRVEPQLQMRSDGGLDMQLPAEWPPANPY